MEKVNLENCFVVNVPHNKHGYSIGVCAEGYDEYSVIDLCLERGFFVDEEDADYAYAEEMTEYDYEHFKDIMRFA
jgi:uncharacterized protein YneR